MALRSGLETRFCLVWTTKRPRWNQQRSSSSFSLMDSEWKLHLKKVSHPLTYSRIYNVVILKQVNKVENLKNWFRVTTFIEGAVDYSFSSLGFTRVVKTGNEIIWLYDQEQVSKHIHFVDKNDGFWRIVCLFHGVQSSTLEEKNATVHLSDQNDFDLPVFIEPLADLESLSLDFSNLFKNGVLSDVKFRCENRTIPAHRAVLVARSKVFANMFRNKMAESETSFVDITDLEVRVLNLLLKYMYSGRLKDPPEDIVLSLYEAIDKYKVRGLKKQCSDWIIMNLTAENCVKYLTFADARGDLAFKNAVISFICGHKEVFESEAWLQINKKPSKLVIDVYQKFFAAENNAKLRSLSERQ